MDNCHIIMAVVIASLPAEDRRHFFLCGPSSVPLRKADTVGGAHLHEDVLPIQTRSNPQEGEHGDSLGGDVP